MCHLRMSRMKLLFKIFTKALQITSISCLIFPSWRKSSKQAKQFFANSSSLHIKNLFFPKGVWFYFSIAQENKMTICAFGLEFMVWKWQSNSKNVWIVETHNKFIDHVHTHTNLLTLFFSCIFLITGKRFSTMKIRYVLPPHVFLDYYKLSIN